MDAAPLSKKAPPADAADDALRSAAQQAAVEPSSPGDAAAAVVAGARRSGGGGEDDDEQVERFYALLDNIRAVRGMLCAGAGAGAATAAGRKRAREAEPPWRPAFRMEDFELEEAQSDDAPACCDGNKRNRWEGSCGGARWRETTTDGEEEKDGEVVEAKGPRRAQHKARRAGVLAVDRAGCR